LNKGDQSGSLELALHLGGLEDRDDQFHPISSHTLDIIENWARSNGY
jgi:hypothetical protein